MKIITVIFLLSSHIIECPSYHRANEYSEFLMQCFCPYSALDLLALAKASTAKICLDYEIEAVVILPDHFHMILTPKVARDYPKIISHIKRSFLYGLDKNLKKIAKAGLSRSKSKRQHSGIWQSRYYEHTIRDEKDFKIRFDYIHFNPVKHQLVSKVNDWDYSSFHKYVKMGWYDSTWGDFDENIEFE